MRMHKYWQTGELNINCPATKVTIVQNFIYIVAAYNELYVLSVCYAHD